MVFKYAEKNPASLFAAKINLLRLEYEESEYIFDNLSNNRKAMNFLIKIICQLLA
jgi:hypothetical protein